jgi:hypothetical protein
VIVRAGGGKFVPAAAFFKSVRVFDANERLSDASTAAKNCAQASCDPAPKYELWPLTLSPTLGIPIVLTMKFAAAR